MSPTSDYNLASSDRRPVTTLTHPTQLHRLRVWPFGRTRGLGRLKLPPELSESHREQWESDLNRYYYACGCNAGAKGVVLATVAMMIYAGWQWSYGHISLGRGGLLVGVGAIVGAIIGKLIGLAIADRKLKLLKREILRTWKVEQPSNSMHIILCG
jgi:hypothetical protein